MFRFLAIAFVSIATAATAQDPAIKLSVAAEEDMYTFVPPNNGSGPFWSFGCTTILRLGDRVVASQMETGEGVPLLCNTRWRLLERGNDGWTLLAEPDGFRQREPAILATAAPNTAFLYVNDSIRPPGEQYGPCEPHLLAFDLAQSPSVPRKISPQWRGTPTFTDHSYRGYAADPASQRLLMLNIDAKTSDQNWCLLTASGETLRNGLITFPIRACYPQAALAGNQGHVLAVGDIVEPVEEWRKFKFEQTQRAWDYVFRILYYTRNTDIANGEFGAPIEIANVDATAGHISNQDLWIAPNGDAYILYTESEVQSALMRDKFFPGKSILPSLYLAVVHDGMLAEKKVLIAASDTVTPGHARFHVTPSGTVYAVLFLGGSDPGNYLMQIHPPLENASLAKVPFAKPFGTFLLATVRAGNAPNSIIDMIGHRDSGTTVAYGQVRIE